MHDCHQQAYEKLYIFILLPLSLLPHTHNVFLKLKTAFNKISYGQQEQTPPDEFKIKARLGNYKPAVYRITGWHAVK